ncbi:hypothetical protein DYBT9275_01347 [Dyadobacter sp. CECT 9275]|uniref:Rhodanese domain-containing protein n=1 Tax=Dyadobacter helix TaxID=2822344 RepID=A0A916NBG2_9BACT|nr:hypothetical protein DYBT9275_01347 [Dyadobacter sp. CECT 9275]
MVKMKKLQPFGFLLLMLVLQNTGFAQNREKSQLLTFEAFEAKLQAAGKDAQILDARLPEEYVQNHLEGAVSFSVTQKDDFARETARLNKDKPVFIYSIGNGRSGVLAKELRENGFTDVTEIPGGLSKWIGLGKPVVSTVGKGLSLSDYAASLNSDKLVLVDFGSRYCGSCKRLAPLLIRLKQSRLMF